MISSGAEVDKANKWKRTVLHECVISNNIAGAKIILESGVNKDIRDYEGRTARELGISRDSMEMVELLTSAGASPEVYISQMLQVFFPESSSSPSIQVNSKIDFF